MGQHHRAAHLVFGLIVLLLAFGRAGAQDPPIRVPFSVTVGGVTSTGVGTVVDVSMQARPLPNGTLYASERVAISKATLGRLARGVLSRANFALDVYLGAKAVVDAAGWAIGELQGQVIIPGTPQSSIPSGTAAWCSTDSGVTRCTSSPSGGCPIIAIVLGATSWWAREGSVCQFQGVDGGVAYYRVTPGGGTMTLQVQYFPDHIPDFSTGSSPVPVTDEQLATQIMATNPQLLDGLLHDSNGNPIITPEIADAMSRFAQQVAAMTGEQGQPVLTPTDWDTSDKGDSSPKSLPEFCSWAAVVCRFIEEFKAQPQLDDPPLPETNAVEEKHWDSGLPSDGVCPADEVATVTMMGTTQEVAFSYAPMCQLATKLRTALIAVCALVSALIVAGVRKGATV